MLSTQTYPLNQTPTLTRWVYLFIVFHIIIWTIAPLWVRYTLPMDAIEGTIWGHQLEWGYDKNPFMNGWLTSLAVYLGNSSGWTIYLFSQLSVALCFLAVWELGKHILPPAYAFIAVLILASLQYYNLHAIDFNDNTLELGLWALTTLFYYLALRDDKLQNWLLTGVFAGLSMMTKYYSAMLLLPMFLLLLTSPQLRIQFKKPGLYLGLSVFLLLVGPHTLWLFSHDLVTINYAVSRVSSESTWLNHLMHPAKFVWEQFLVFIPALVLLLILTVGKKTRSELSVSAFDKTFLIFVALGPCLLTVLLSVIGGIKLRAGWGQPLLTLWGLLFFVWYTPKLTRARVIYFGVTLSAIVIGMNMSYCVALIKANQPSSANFPGQVIAQTVEAEWHKTYASPLTYVVGPRWMAGNIAFYSQDHPSVYMEANIKVSPWIDEKKLDSQGAIFIWDPMEEHQLSYAELKQRFPRLGMMRLMHFAWLRNATMAPVAMGVAFLAPEKS